MATTFSPSPCNAALTPERLIRAAAELRGACRVGYAEAGPVDDRHVAIYRNWIAAGRHGSMTYLERYDDIRRDPRLLLDGARSIICPAYITSTRSAMFATTPMSCVIRIIAIPVSCCSSLSRFIICA